MPDIHWGYGFPIGGVAATDPGRAASISPGGVGFDINCGVRLLRADLRRRRSCGPCCRTLMDGLDPAVPRGMGRARCWRLSGRTT